MTEIEKEFKETICERSAEIDCEEYDWFSLSLGWALAKLLISLNSFRLTM